MSFSGLDLAISIPSNYAFSPIANVTARAPIQTQLKVSADRLQQSSCLDSDCLTQIWNAIASFVQRVWDFLFCKTAEPVSSALTAPITTTSVEDETERQRVQAIWQQKMGENLNPLNQIGPSFLDLGGSLNQIGRWNAIGMRQIPYLGHYQHLSHHIAVKLPRRQLDQFPDAIKNQLSNYDADHLDLYFIVWKDFPRFLERNIDPGKRNLIYHPIAFPNAQI